MKGIDPLISTFLIIVITIAAIALVLKVGTPATGRAQEILLLEEGKNNLANIDTAVKNVLQEGQGSTRVLTLIVSGGVYSIDPASDNITFVMDSRSQIVGVGITQVENDITIAGSQGSVRLTLSYNSLDVVNGGNFGKGTNTITINNGGYNLTSNKQTISVKP